MIYITGDIHGESRRFCDECMPGESKWIADDKLIVCGDFGLIWYNSDDYTGKKSNDMALDDLATRPYEILFIDGNHKTSMSCINIPRLKDTVLPFIKFVTTFIILNEVEFIQSKTKCSLLLVVLTVLINA